MKAAAPTTCLSCGHALSPATLDGLCPQCVGQIFLSPTPSEAITVAGKMVVPASTAFGQYELLEEIARGGMGVVFKARHRPLNRIVAVKMMLTGRLAGPANAQRFRAEAAAVAQLQHPNIVAIHEIGEHEGCPFFSMDYVEGVNFAELVRRKILSAPHAATQLKTIAEAVHYAHQQGVIHRDLKPSNIMLDAAGRPRVTDFGLAKRLTDLTDSHLALTVTGQVLGTPAFIPPEQAGGQPGKVGPGSDIYSLGAMLYFMLTGQPPFSGKNLEETLAHVAQRAPVSLRKINPAVPRDLETICLKCLEKNPAQRYLTAQALADDLARFLRDEPIAARPVATAEKLWRICRRHPAIVGLTASLAVALIFLFALLGDRVASLFQKQIIPDLPLRSANGYSGFIDGKLYVATAADGTAGFRNFFHVYDPSRNTWQPLPEPPVPHGVGASGVINGKLYVAGGCDWNGVKTSRLDVFDPGTGSWTTKAPMPTVRDACAGVVFKGKFYVVGGSDPKEKSLGIFQCYDPARDVWTTAEPLPHPRNGLGAGILDNKLYAVGGTVGEQRCALVEVYDFAARQWTAGPPMPASRREPFVVAQNGILYVAGGENLAMQATLWALRPKALRWEELAPMPEGRYLGDGAQVVNGSIWCIGGWTYDGAVHANIFIYQPKLNCWTSSGTGK